MSAAHHAYRQFDLTFVSDLALPEMSGGAEPTGKEAADVVIERGSVPADGAQIGPQIGPFSHAVAQVLWLRVPGVARFLIENGTRIVYDPEPGIDEDSIRVFFNEVHELYIKVGAPRPTSLVPAFPISRLSAS